LQFSQRRIERGVTARAKIRHRRMYDDIRLYADADELFAVRISVPLATDSRAPAARQFEEKRLAGAAACRVSDNLSAPHGIERDGKILRG
jgi:hypothetical protein